MNCFNFTNSELVCHKNRIMNYMIDTLDSLNTEKRLMLFSFFVCMLTIYSVLKREFEEDECDGSECDESESESESECEEENLNLNEVREKLENTKTEASEYRKKYRDLLEKLKLYTQLERSLSENHLLLRKLNSHVEDIELKMNVFEEKLNKLVELPEIVYGDKIIKTPKCSTPVNANVVKKSLFKKSQ